MLTGKNAIITGARSGIGLATLQLFAKNGCNCWAVIHRDDEQFLMTIHQLEEGLDTGDIIFRKEVVMDKNEETFCS